MKKHFLFCVMTMLSLMASAQDIEVKNANGKTIYYNYINNNTELEVTFQGYSYSSYYNEYQGDVVIPEEVTIMNRTRKVTRINSDAFRSCNVTSVTIPNSVKSIGGSAFYGCHLMTSVTIGNSVTSIGGSAFYGCEALTSITIPNSVTSIENTTFSDCRALTSITIPNSVTRIGANAFDHCTGLTSITIGCGLTNIEEKAFIYCKGLKKVIVSDIAAWCAIEFGRFDANPLYYAHHLYSDENTEIKDLVIPNSVTSIGVSAFYGCSGLTSVTIPNSVTSIYGSAFAGCSGLKKVIVSDIAAWCGIKFGDNPLHDAHHLYSDENTEIKDLVIPNSVTSIESSAFSGCSGLTSVTIPNSVTSIGDCAFYGCSGLTSVTIPNSVTSIKSITFSGCSGLTSVTIPNSVTSIGDGAFEYCSGLTSIVIPNSVTSIGDYAFSGCSGLTSITIPNSVTSIGKMAFSDCSGLTSVTIPNSVTSIGGGAFSGADIPTVVSLIENPFKISESTFSKNTFENGTLYVPEGTIRNYANTDGWNKFWFKEEGVPAGIDAVVKTKNKNDKTTIYDLNGRKLVGEPAQKGIYISNGRKVVMK